MAISRRVGWFPGMLAVCAVLLTSAHMAHAAGFADAGSLSTGRYHHTATLLLSGKVLVTGGDAGSSPFTSAELYDPSAPAASAWSSAGNMAVGHTSHTATLLPSGKVLIAGDGVGSSAELYDPSAPVASAWSSAGNMAVSRSEHTATLLLNGKVLVTGGVHNGSTGLSAAELYDPSAPAASAWSSAGTMSTIRRFHSATLLANGKVLVAGGDDFSSSLSSAELYDSSATAASAWSTAGNMLTAREAHAATLLPNGKLLVAGGAGNTNPNILNSAELFDPSVPAASAWSAAGNMSASRFGPTGTLLSSGKVLVTGGSDNTGFPTVSTELYNPLAPAASAWSSAGNMSAKRGGHSATLLANNKVLVAAGAANGSAYLNSSELYSDASALNRWHLAILIPGTYQVPSGSIYTSPYAVATFGETTATINSMEITYTDTTTNQRNYDCQGILHTANNLTTTVFSGDQGAGQIGRLTNGYPATMTFYASYDFENSTFATSTPGNGSVATNTRSPLNFDATKTLWARAWFNRGDGNLGPQVSNLQLLADITSVLMPGASIQSNNQNTITWSPSPCTAAVAQKLYRALAATGPFTLLQSFADNTTSSFKDTTASPGNTYYFKVVAEAAGGVIGADSNVLAVTLPPAPPQVTAMSPVPNSSAPSTLTSITVDFSKPVLASSINPASVLLVRAGPDGIFDTADDVAVTLQAAQIQMTTSTRMTISGLTLTPDKYRVSLIGAVKGTTSSSDAIVTVPNFGLVTPTDNYTIEFWQFFTGGQFHLPTSFQLTPIVSGNVYQFHSPWNSGPDFFFWDLGGDRNGITNVGTRAVWAHFALVKSGTSIKVYWNGNLIFTGALTTQFTNYLSDLQLPSGGPQPFLGRIDEFRIWNVVRTAAQIKTYMNRTMSGSEPGLMAYWDFNEGSGTVSNDKTGHGYNGAMATPVAWAASDVPLIPPVTDQSNNILDGEFSGTFPSGNGIAGGDFNAQFTVSPPPLVVTAMTPVPNSSVATQPSSILLTFNSALTTSVNYKNAVVVTRAGSDGILGTADDVVVTPTSVVMVGTTQLQVNLPASLPYDIYQVRLPSLALPPPLISVAASSPYNISKADMNGDNKADLIVTNRASPDPSLYLGNGTGAFSTASTFNLFGTGLSNVTYADINGDGKLDLISGSDGATNTTSVALNTGTPPGAPTFGTVNTFTMGNNCLNVQAVDLNGDGMPDLVTANFADSSISIRFNTTAPGATTPMFSAPVTYLSGGSTRFIAIGDVNGDGKPDIVAVNYGASTISVFLNTTPIGGTTPIFAAPATYATDSNPYTAAFVDLNGDGKPDLVVSCYNGNSINVFMNTTPTNASAPSFSAKTSISVATNPSYIGVADLDGDGKMDVVVTCEGSANVAVFMNTTPALSATPSFAAAYRIATGTTPTSVAVGDLSGNGDIGLATANNGGNSLTLAYPYPRAVTDSNGTQLDGEFSGTFPSGNSIAGGDFVAKFTLGSVGPTTTTVTTPAAITYGTASVSLSASVTASGTTVGTGTVTFQLMNGVTNVGSAIAGIVASGNAIVTYAIPAGTGPGSYTISAIYNGAGAYQNSSDALKHLVISAAPLSVTPANQIRNYASANPALTGAIVGIKNSDNITANYATSALASSPAGPYSITATLNDPNGKLGNYSVTLNNGTLTVFKVPLTVAANGASRAYGAANPALTGTLTGVVNGDNITAMYATTATPASAFGSYAIIPTVVDPGSALVNYNLTITNGTLSVTKAPLTVSANSFLRAYGATNPTFLGSVTGVVNGDNITASYSTVATVNSSVGNYAIVPALADPGSKLGNYTLTQNNGVLTISNATVLLVITPDSFTRVYGDANPALTGTISGLLNGDNINAAYATSANIVSGVNNYAISATLIDPNSRLQNYTVNLNQGQLTVSKAGLTVTGDGFNRLYGAANPPLTGAIAGIKNGDNITATYSTVATPSSAIGNYANVPTLADPGSKLANYTVTSNNGVLSVNQAALTVTANSAGRAYGAANPGFGGTIAGILNGDNITATYATNATPSSAIGNYAIVPTLVDPGSKLANYAVTSNNGTLTVGKTALSVTANDAGRTYGIPNPAFSGVIAGIQNGDNITAAYATSATVGSPVGPYAITPTLVDPSNKLGNYATTSNNGTLTIGKAPPIVVTPTNFSRLYGAANPAFTGAVTGVLNGDNITATYATTATPASVIGNYAIVPTLIDPNSKLSNYNFSLNNGQLSVTKAALSVTADGFTRLYGAANPLLTGTILGIQNGDNISAAYATVATPSSAIGNYATVPTLVDPGSKLANYAVISTNGVLAVNQAPLSVTASNTGRTYGAVNPVFVGIVIGIQNGDNITATYATSATLTSIVGAYDIIPTLVDPDIKLGNYAVAINNGTLAIGIAPAIVVTPNNFNRTYGALNPIFDGVITGVLNGDNVTATYATVATPASIVGNYAITLTLLDPNNMLVNYALVTNNGTLTIAPAALSVAAADKTKIYGDANPVLSGTILGIQNSDDITATYATAATPASAIGGYVIVPTLVDPNSKLSNYTVTAANATLTVSQASLTVVAADASRVYHDANPAFTGTITGLRNNDAITANYATGATPSSPAGTYDIVPTWVDLNGLLSNYTATIVNGKLTVGKATPAIAWAAPSGIFAGVPLSSTQLNAAASDSITSAALPGTFAFTPDFGTVLAPGLAQLLSVTFTPNDAANYKTKTASSTVDVAPAIPVVITSPKTASGTIGTTFSYTITADGSAPMTFAAAGLPSWLSLSGAVISGTPTATGVFNIVLTATNYSGSASQPLRLVVTQASGTNHPPVFSSPPAASSNPASTGVAVTLTANATDADGDALDYTWDFGDGTSGAGASVSKTYAAAGVFIVKVVVSDGQASDVQSINMAVNDQPAAGTFAVVKVGVAFNFTKSGNDILKVYGQIPIPAGFNPDGKSVRILIGGVDKAYVLNSKGSSADKAFILTGKPNNGASGFTFSLKKQDLFAQLENLGFSKTKSNPSLIFPVVIVLDGKSYFDSPKIDYKVKSGKNGPISGKGK